MVGAGQWTIGSSVVEHHVETASTDQWASRGADALDFAIRSAVELRGQCVAALSGGTTPLPVFDELASRDLPWDQVVFTQVDERMVPSGDPARNLTAQKEAFAGLPVRWLPLPVEDDSQTAQDDYLAALAEVAGAPPQLDVVHLGLGSDGHTASLVPRDPVLDIEDRDVARTEPYQGHARLTMTRPILDRARLVVWLVQGPLKAAILARLVYGDSTMPAGKLEPQQSIIVADSAAAAAAR